MFPCIWPLIAIEFAHVVTRVPNRGSPPAILLRESYRADGKVRTRTLANLSRWSEAKIEALRRVLKGEAVVAPRGQLAIERSLPHGHVAAVLGFARKLGLDRLVPRRPERLATLALALVLARVLEPAAKLATARQLSEPSAADLLGAILGLGAVDEDGAGQDRGEARPVPSRGRLPGALRPHLELAGGPLLRARPHSCRRQLRQHVSGSSLILGADW